MMGIERMMVCQVMMQKQKNERQLVTLIGKPNHVMEIPQGIKNPQMTEKDIDDKTINKDKTNVFINIFNIV